MKKIHATVTVIEMKYEVCIKITRRKGKRNVEVILDTCFTVLDPYMYLLKKIDERRNWRISYVKHILASLIYKIIQEKRESVEITLSDVEKIIKEIVKHVRNVDLDSTLHQLSSKLENRSTRIKNLFKFSSYEIDRALREFEKEICGKDLEKIINVLRKYLPG